MNEKNNESEYASNVEELLREKENRKKKIRNTVITAAGSIIFPLITIYNAITFSTIKPEILFGMMLGPAVISFVFFIELSGSIGSLTKSNEKIKNLEKKVNMQDERRKAQKIDEIPKEKEKKEIESPIKKEQSTKPNYNKYQLRKR